MRHAVEIRHENFLTDFFFDSTDVKLRAPFDAQAFVRKLGLAPGPGFTPVERAGVTARRVRYHRTRDDVMENV